MSNIARTEWGACYIRPPDLATPSRRLECSERARGTEEGEVSLREAERGRKEREKKRATKQVISPEEEEESQVDENGATHSTDRHLFAY